MVVIVISARVLPVASTTVVIIASTRAGDGGAGEKWSNRFYLKLRGQI